MDSSAETITETHCILHADWVSDMVRTVSKHLPGSVSKDDLYQAGMIGLIQATRKYDTQNSACFKTYALHRIKGAMLDELRKQDPLSRQQRKNVKAMMAAKDRIENEMMSPASSQQIADDLDIDSDTYHQTRLNYSEGQTSSFDEWPAGTLDNICFQLEWTDKIDEDDVDLDILKQAIGRLSDIQMKILQWRYYQEYSFIAIGRLLKVTESGAWYLHDKMLRDLKRHFDNVAISFRDQ